MRGQRLRRALAGSGRRAIRGDARAVLRQELDQRQLVSVVERMPISETLDDVRAAGQQQCGTEQLAFGPLALEALGKPQIVEQP